MKIDDSSVLREYFDERVSKVETELTEKLKRINMTLTRKLDRLVTDNLLVPNSIGPDGSGCPFKNLK